VKTTTPLLYVLKAKRLTKRRKASLWCTG